MNEGAPDRLLLRPNEAAEALAISPRTLWSLEIPRVRVGKRGIRYDVVDILAWIRQQKTQLDKLSDV